MKIDELLKKGESETREFKERFDNEAIETADAFANTSGGLILIGVNDAGRVIGASIGKETLKEWANRIMQATEPTVIPEMKDCRVEGKTVVKITVNESPIKPVAYKGVCYMRVKNSNRKLTPKEIAEIHLRTTGSSWDGYPARDARPEDVDMQNVEDYIKLANETGRRKIRENPAQVLKKLDLVKGGRPTWAAILLFGKEPQRLLLQAKIHCGRFKLSKQVILDDKMIDGTLVRQVDEAMEFVKKHLKLSFVITGKPRRDEIWEYPLDALREAIINAIVHRDYTLPSEIQIEIYDDRIEIWSPGKLPLGIRIEDLYKRDHKSIPRNRLVAQTFYDLELIEKYGSGTIRMLELCRKANIFLDFEENSGGFSAIFRKDVFTEEHLMDLGLNERQIRAVAAIKECTGSSILKEIN